MKQNEERKNQHKYVDLHSLVYNYEYSFTVQKELKS